MMSPGLKIQLLLDNVLFYQCSEISEEFQRKKKYCERNTLQISEILKQAHRWLLIHMKAHNVKAVIINDV